LGVLPALWLWAQAPPSSAPAAPAAPANPFQLSPEERARLDQLAREDHADMMRQLGITKIRPGFNGRATAGEPNAANHDPAKANPYPDWPDVLTLKDGTKVTTAEMWWQKRRPEIVLDFEREVYGRVPAEVPKVTWTVAETVETTVGGQPVVARMLIGHVDNSAHPAITVDIQMAVVLPVHAKGKVPVLVMFGWGNMPGEPLPRFPGAQEPAAPPSTEQLIAAGWATYRSAPPASRPSTSFWSHSAQRSWRFFSHDGQKDLPRQENGHSTLARHVGHQSRAKPCSTRPHRMNPRSTRSTTGRRGPCCPAKRVGQTRSSSSRCCSNRRKSGDSRARLRL